MAVPQAVLLFLASMFSKALSGTASGSHIFRKAMMRWAWVVLKLGQFVANMPHVETKNDLTVGSLKRPVLVA